MKMLITTDAVGGVWTYSLAIARGFCAEGHRVFLAIVGPAPDGTRLGEAAAIDGCSVLQTGLPLEWTLDLGAGFDDVVAGLIEAARATGSDAAHLHAPALAAGAWPVPVVAVAHSCMGTWWDSVQGGARPAEIAWHARATSLGLCRARACIAPSHAFAAQLSATYAPARNPRVIYNGLPPAAPQQAAARHGVLCAGRLWDASKNIALLDRVASRTGLPVDAAGPVAAPGGSPARFSSLRLLGNLSPAALRSAMAHAAVFASPALYEPFGLSVLEAAQQATPLALSDIPTCRELWDGAALFLPPRDEAAWSAALSALVADEARREELGRAAQERARLYTQDRMVRTTLALHAELHDQARAA